TLKTEEKIQEELAEYARKQLDQGLTEEEVKAKLITAGHTEEKAERHIRHAQKKLRGINKELANETRQVEKAKKAVEKDIDKELLQYIQNQKEAGYTEEEIAEALKKEGHKEEHIKRHIAKIRESGKTRSDYRTNGFSHLTRQGEENLSSWQTSGKNGSPTQTGQVEENLRSSRQKNIPNVAHKLHSFLSEASHAIWHKEYVLALLILCGLILAIHYVVMPSYNYMDSIAEGNKAYEAENYIQAEEYYLQAYNTKHTPTATLQLARSYLRQAEHKQALQKYEEYEKIAPESYLGTAGAGIALVSMQEYDKAIEKLQQSLQIEDTETANRFLGRAYLGKNMTSEAEQYFQKALEVNRTAQGIKELGEFYISQQRIDEAQALLLESKSAGIACILASSYIQAKQFNKSVAYARQCAEENQNDKYSQLMLARSYHFSGKHNNATKEYLKYFEMTDQSDQEYNKTVEQIGMAYYNNGEYEEAVEWFERLGIYNASMASNVYNNDNAPILEILGKSYYYLNDYQSAIRSLELASYLGPASTKGEILLAKLYRKKGDAENEVKILRKIMAKNPDAIIYSKYISDSGNTPDYEDGLLHILSICTEQEVCTLLAGQVFRNKGKYEEAVAAFNSIVDQTENLNMRYCLTMEKGITYKVLKDYERAEKEFKSALDMNISKSRAHMEIGFLYLNTNRLFEAKESFMAALELTDNSPENFTRISSYAGLALAHFSEGDILKATEAYENVKNIDSSFVSFFPNFRAIGDSIKIS
ncbi:MAG: tetratricopeptide repeat protein, partial [Candidatus Woesearchaeota archaeon]